MPRGPEPGTGVPADFLSSVVQLWSVLASGGCCLPILIRPFFGAGCKNFPVPLSIQRSLCVSLVPQGAVGVRNSLRGLGEFGSELTWIRVPHSS